MWHCGICNECNARDLRYKFKVDWNGDDLIDFYCDCRTSEHDSGLRWCIYIKEDVLK